MNVLFVTLVGIISIEDRGIYQDLLRQFRNKGHDVTIVTPVERRKGIAANYRQKDGVSILQVKTLNVTKTNLIEKGVGTVLLEYQFLSAIKKYLSTKKFDLVLYSTPPITFSRVIQFIKKRDNAKSYLLLKDIFPQNAVDLGMMKRDGILHRFFQRKEKQLYKVSDYIGCMSPANVQYLLQHNPKIYSKNVEVNPNSIELAEDSKAEPDKMQLRRELDLPENKTIFIYGGNLGKPQGLDFLLEMMEACTPIEEAYFIVAGSGTEYAKIKRWFDQKMPSNAQLIKALPKPEYDRLVRACDVGLIFLDKRFTIPNYPSRLLSYLENHMPVISATDSNTDIGKISAENNYGFWVLNGDAEGFKSYITRLIQDSALINRMGNNGYNYLINNYTAAQSYNIIMSHFESDQ
jgi:glycosyltransferase involved in cell wall biosynthesis